MSAEREISIDMTTDERAAMITGPEAEDLDLSPAARVVLETAAPNPVGGWWFTCSLDVAHELLAWAEAGVSRWSGRDPARAAPFAASVTQIRFGLLKARC